MDNLLSNFARNISRLFGSRFVNNSKLEMYRKLKNILQIKLAGRSNGLLPKKQIKWTRVPPLLRCTSTPSLTPHLADKSRAMCPIISNHPPQLMPILISQPLQEPPLWQQLQLTQPQQLTIKLRQQFQKAVNRTETQCT